MIESFLTLRHALSGSDVRRTFSICIAAFGMVSCMNTTPSALQTGAIAGDMELSPFYSWDGALPDKPGKLLKTETIPTQSDMPSAREAVRLLHTSTDVRWNSGLIPVSSTVFLPEGPPPAGGWPVIAWGHGTVGLADVCAPSWTGFKPRDAAYLDAWLDAGFAVVAPDYQGLGGPGQHPYLHWQTSGRSMLDSIRAARELAPESISDRVILAGQSQGSGAAIGAGIMAAEYAAELDILGVIATGANVTFPEGPVSLPIRNSGNFFLSIVSGGLRDDAPDVEEILNDKGRQLLATSRIACTKELGMQAQELGIASLEDAFTVSIEELAEYRRQITDMPMVAVSSPFLIATGLDDETVEPIRQFAVASALCESGNTVSWQSYEGMDHDNALMGSFNDSHSFATDLLEGRSVKANCDLLNQSEIAPIEP